MTSAERRPRVLFLCTGNSCRSQMAEGWARSLKTGAIEAFSAGRKPQGMNPPAIRATAEVGVDVSGHSSKRPTDLGVEFEYVVTVCDAAHEACPVFPARTRVIHVGFDDPPRLAKGATSDDEALPHHRRVRDEIRAFIERICASLSGWRALRKREPDGHDKGCGSARVLLGRGAWSRARRRAGSLRGGSAAAREPRI